MNDIDQLKNAIKEYAGPTAVEFNNPRDRLMTEPPTSLRKVV